MVKKYLAPNSNKLHKSSTVVLSVILALLSLLELINQHLALIAPVLSPTIYPWVAFGLAIAIGVGRYVHQRCLTLEQTEESSNAEATSE